MGKTFFEMLQLIQEAQYGPFSDNWKYSPPKDFSDLLGDFYGLTAVMNQWRGAAVGDEADLSRRRGTRLLNNIENAHKSATLALKEYFLKVIPYVVSVELRHLHMQGHEYKKSGTPLGNTLDKMFNRLEDVTGYHSKHSPDATNLHNVRGQTYKDYRPNDIDSRNSHPELANAAAFLNKEKQSKQQKARDPLTQVNYYKFFVNHFGSNDELIDFAIQAFNARRALWVSGFGGKTWAKIAQYYKILKNTNDKNIWRIVSVLDEIIDLEHNTGSAFDKIAQIYKPTPSPFTREQLHLFHWFPDFLDAKAQHPTPHGFYNNLSNKGQQLVAAFYKATKDFTVEDYQNTLKFHKASDYGKHPNAGDPKHRELYDKHKHLVKAPEEIVVKEKSIDRDDDDDDWDFPGPWGGHMTGKSPRPEDLELTNYDDDDDLDYDDYDPDPDDEDYDDEWEDEQDAKWEDEEEEDEYEDEFDDDTLKALKQSMSPEQYQRWMRDYYNL